MTELKSGLTKSWKEIAPLIDFLSIEDGKIPQIELDILLAAIRNFYQNIHDINISNKKSCAIEEVFIHEAVKDGDFFDDRNQERKYLKDKEFEKPVEEATNLQEFEEKDIEPEPNSTNIEELINIQPEIELNTAIEIPIIEESVEEPKKEVSVEDKIEIFENETQSENEIPTNTTELENNILTNDPQVEVIAETQIQKEIVDEVKEEAKQSSLFEYLQTSDIEQAAQNISKYISTENQTPLTVADKFKQEQPSVIEKITIESNDYSIGTKIQQQPIKDLRDIIGINEKFLFINDLFSGNMKDYNDFIIYLNSLSSNEEAMFFVQEVLTNRKWSETSHAYTTLMQIIKRRF